MKRIIVVVFACIGALLTLVIAAGAGYWAYGTHRDESPDVENLMYILNWANLGTHSKIETVLNRCITPVNPVVGDHVKAFALQIASVPTEFWESESIREKWRRGPVADPVLIEAIETASMFARSDNCNWFPEAAELNSDRFMLSFPQITLYNLRAETVQLTAYDTKTGHLYHADIAW